MRIITLLTTLCLLTGCSTDQKPQMPEMPAIPVVAKTPEVKDITSYIESIGTLQPSRQMEVRPQVDGTLKSILVTEGQSVEKDSPLFEIDPVYHEIKVHEAEAQLAMDQAAYDQAKRKMERYQNLADKDFISKTEWDELETQVVKARATLDADEARLRTAKLDLDYCVIRAPIEGKIGKLDIHPGQLVAQRQTESLATITDLDPLVVEFSITEKEYAKLPSNELTLQIEPLCAGQKNKEGSITFIDNSFDAKTGLLLIKGQISNADCVLRPGQSVRIKIPVEVAEGAKIIPQKAIRYNPNGPYVYVVQDDSTVVLRQIELGEELNSDQIVLKGLESHEQVVVEGHLRLSPGSKVEQKS